MDDQAQHDAERLRRFTYWAHKVGMRVTVTTGSQSCSIAVERPDPKTGKWAKVASYSGDDAHATISKLTIPKTK